MGALAMTRDRPDLTPGDAPGRRTERGYFAAFRAVRRQRVQTSAFVSTPFWRITKGWRFGW